MASQLLGGNFLGGKVVWWRDDRKPSQQSPYAVVWQQTQLACLMTREISYRKNTLKFACSKAAYKNSLHACILHVACVLIHHIARILRACNSAIPAACAVHSSLINSSLVNSLIGQTTLGNKSAIVSDYHVNNRLRNVGRLFRSFLPSIFSFNHTFFFRVSYIKSLKPMSC